MKHIPNIITLCNVVAGCLAIIFILQTSESIVVINGYDTLLNLPEKITWGAICIFVAAGIDVIDGFVARLCKVTSALGKQLDSLCDVVSFGVAPGMILYQLLRISYAQQENGLDVSMLYLAPCAIFPAAAAYRLGKFNIDTRQTYHFIGLPTPAAGLLISALPLILHYHYFNVNDIILNKWFLYTLTLVMSYLMISPLPLLSLKIQPGGLKNNWEKLLLILLAIISIVFLKWLAVPIILSIYILLSLFLQRNKK